MQNGRMLSDKSKEELQSPDHLRLSVYSQNMQISTSGIQRQHFFANLSTSYCKYLTRPAKLAFDKRSQELWACIISWRLEIWKPNILVDNF
jgi:hypothetical protein